MRCAELLPPPPPPFLLFPLAAKKLAHVLYISEVHLDLCILFGDFLVPLLPTVDIDSHVIKDQEIDPEKYRGRIRPDAECGVTSHTQGHAICDDLRRLE